MKFIVLIVALATSVAQTIYDVIVVGGGVSGLAAASAARANGWSVLILEGRTRMGGRVWTNRDFGYALDFGASWIHGIQANPLTSLAAQAGASCVVTDYNLNSMFTSTGSKYTSAQATAADTLWATFLNSVSSAIAARNGRGDPDVSLQSMVDATILAGSFSPEQLMLLNYSLTSALEQEYAADASSLSAYSYDSGARIRGNDCVFPLGYDALVQRLLQVNASGSVVMMGQNVTRVNTGGCSRGLPASVQTADGTLYVGRSVIVTVPLGVLQRGRIAFTPPLPAVVQTAISRLGMGLLNKYAIEFASAPDNSDTDRWPSPATFMYNRVGPNKTSNVFAEYINWQYVTGKATDLSVKPAKRTLIGFASGAAAAALASVPDAVISARIRSELEQAMSTSLGAPTNFMRTKWELDEWAFGSYSYFAVGALPADRAAFSTGLPASSCLRFAGEHTSVKEAATVHGALKTGLAAVANLVLPVPSASASPAASMSAAPAALAGDVLQPAGVAMPAVYINAPSAAVLQATGSLKQDVLDALSVPAAGVAVDVTVTASTARRLQTNSSAIVNLVRVDTRIRIVNAAAFGGASRSPAPAARAPTAPRGASALPSISAGATAVNDAAVDAALASVTSAVAQLQAYAGGGNFSTANVDGEDSMRADDVLADFEDDLASITGTSTDTLTTYMALTPPQVSRYVALAASAIAIGAPSATPSPVVNATSLSSITVANLASSPSSASLSGGVVAAIVIGCVAGVVALVAGAALTLRRARVIATKKVLTSAGGQTDAIGKSPRAVQSASAVRSAPSAV